jgi:hypothetical protein
MGLYPNRIVRQKKKILVGDILRSEKKNEEKGYDTRGSGM